jgi:hypothetical protein
MEIIKRVGKRQQPQSNMFFLFILYVPLISGAATLRARVQMNPLTPYFFFLIYR